MIGEKGGLFMMISTKGRYALRFLVDVAEHQEGGYVPLRDVALRQGISEKYLELVVKELVKGGLLLAGSTALWRSTA